MTMEHLKNTGSHRPSEERGTERRRYAPILTSVAVVGFAAAFAGDAGAVTGVVAEGVSDYTYMSGGSTSNDTDCATEASGFYNGITTAGSGWTTVHMYQNSSVWDTDFIDPDAPGSIVGDNDTGNFDPAAAVSFVC